MLLKVVAVRRVSVLASAKYCPELSEDKLEIHHPWCICLDCEIQYCDEDNFNVNYMACLGSKPYISFLHFILKFNFRFSL